MPSALSLATAVKTKTIGLPSWMQRVPNEVARVRQDWSVDAIHDLRVALRRCRTMADALREVNPDPGWRKIRKSTGALFHLLGELRDTQVKRKWLKKLSVPGDPLRKQMLRLLAAEEKVHRKAAAEALHNFDRKSWRKLTRKLESKAQFFPLESVVFQRQALARLNDAVDLHQKARKRPSSAAWHRLRIGIKQFRYIVENFLPQRYDVWADDLKKMQDLLGELHDLDVLRSTVRRLGANFDALVLAQWLEKIDVERRARLDEFRAKTANGNSPWLIWRAGFPWGHAMSIGSVPEPMPLRLAERYAS
jgi:CHAD domain-containing protein